MSTSNSGTASSPPDPTSVPGWRDLRTGSPHVDDLLRVLDLDCDGDGGFVGTSLARPESRIFGGQVLAQCVVAATRSVDTGAAVHSLHAYFVRAGRPRSPIRFVVDRVRDGRSFHVRRVDAVQDGAVICAVTASLQVPEEGLSHQDPMPDAPARALLPARFPFAAAVHDDRPPGPVEIRDCPVEAGPDAGSAVWMRIAATLPDDPLLHRALLVYLSDFTILHSAYRRHGLRRSIIRSASLDHALWLHRDGRVDDWLLYRSHSPSAAGGRAFGTAALFGADGRLLASAGQEMVIRLLGEGGTPAGGREEPGTRPTTPPR